MDRYLRAQAAQDARRHVAAPYVMVQSGTSAVIGYYTLSSASVLACDLPPAFAKKLPRYPVLPATLLGRLAVDFRHRGEGLGSILLLDALRRCSESQIASLAVLVDAKDATARAFYERREFLSLADQPRRLFKPMTEVAKLFA